MELKSDMSSDKKLLEYSEGERVLSFLLVARKDIKRTRDGDVYWDMELQDSSGRLNAKVWNDVLMQEKHRGAEISEGDVIKVEAFVEPPYKKGARKQLRVVQFRKTAPDEEIDLQELYPATPYDIEALYGRLLEFVKRVEKLHIRRLLETFFAEDELFIDEFKKCAGGLTIHHDYIGGNLEHTVSVLEICDFLAGHYPDIDRDILFAGAMLHDVGKVREMAIGRYTTEGEFFGHIVLGYEMVKEKISKIADFPKSEEQALLHIVLSHCGEYEFGAPVLPKTKEALLFHYADNMDAKLFQCYKEIRNAPEDESDWTEKNWLFGRRFYKQPLKNDEVKK